MSAEFVLKLEGVLGRDLLGTMSVNECGLHVSDALKDL
jgi:hypothetical protein